MAHARQRLIDERAVTQLRRGEGRMAALGSENGVPMLDWVEGVERLLRDSHGPEEVEAEARALMERGVRRIIWAGMGGSVMTVRVLADLGLYDETSGPVIYPLDSTDPAALNAIVRRLATSKGLDLSGDLDLPQLFGDVLMVAVSMGMTSEEPITHLEWFVECLAEAGLPVQDHALVMTLPGSYLDDFARRHRLPTRPLQLDGRTATPGRMSAPATRVFLLPAALALAGEGGQLRAVLEEAWQNHHLNRAERNPARHPFVRLAAALSDAAVDGRCGLMLRLASGHQALLPWIEQLVEESLGKEEKGVVVFSDQPAAMPTGQAGTLRVSVGEPAAPEGVFHLDAPALNQSDARSALAALATCFLGWELTVALYGYLEGIVFAGQPAVENYKARSRLLRRNPSPLDAATAEGSAVRSDAITLILPSGSPVTGSPEDVLVALLRETRGRLSYLDLTVNGELGADATERVEQQMREIGNLDLQVPVKVRRAPAAYHATEQSEMDGPPHLLSLRTVCRHHASPLVGSYSAAFLAAQAVATWQAMNEQGRSCSLLILEGSAEKAAPALIELLGGVQRRLSIGEA
jgi:hypothetical protein